MASAPGSTPLGRVEVGLVAFAAVAGLAAARLYPLWRDHLFIGCPLLTITGVPCVTCGGTRAVAALAQGRLLDALAWNPLVALAGAAAAIFVPLAVPVVAGVAQAPRVPARLPRRVAWFVAGLLAVNWLYLLLWFRG